MKYQIKTFREENPKQETDIFERIEKKITLSKEEMYKNLKSKNENGECIVMYEGAERNGVIMALSTTGKAVIGILTEEYPLPQTK
jgi:hypothetical protein